MLKTLAVLATVLLNSLATARAADITVGDECALADAIEAANSDAAAGGCLAGAGADTIWLSDDMTLTAELSYIESDITVEGNGLCHKRQSQSSYLFCW